ncbi:MAG TPA: FAD-dependent oxidoreductase [Ktedonobacteraceae bacterium]|nr:FAD-dependent oxidoreductase [Ktedonobacteraceae bacterium]
MRAVDIVIIGGGVVGASLAYSLSMRGALWVHLREYHQEKSIEE